VHETRDGSEETAAAHDAVETNMLGKILIDID